jgi:hypothetical protein
VSDYREAYIRELHAEVQRLRAASELDHAAVREVLDAVDRGTTAEAQMALGNLRHRAASWSRGGAVTVADQALVQENVRLARENAGLRARDASMVNACNEIAEAIGEVKRQMAFDDDATIHDVLDSFRSTCSELGEALEENKALRAELAADRAAVSSLAAALPKCGVCGKPATHVVRGDVDDFACDAHGGCNWEDVGHAAPLHALQARMAAWDAGEGKTAQAAAAAADRGPLDGVLSAASAAVATWPEWKRSDDVKRRRREFDDRLARLGIRRETPAADPGATGDDFVDVDAADHGRDVARIRQALEAEADVSAAIDWADFWQRRARLGKAAEAIEVPVEATVEWMAQEREVGAQDHDGARPPLAEGQTWRLPCGAEVHVRGGPTGRLVGVGGDRYDVFFDTEAPVGWIFVRGPEADGALAEQPPTRREPSSPPLPPEPDDEQSRYDAEVAERAWR